MIRETKEYGMFKFYNNNRVVNAKQVEKIKD